MNTSIPFYRNHGHRCAQVSMKSILKAIYPDRKFTIRELETATYHQGNEITYPSQIAMGFLNMDVPFRYYVKPSIRIVATDGADGLRRLAEEACGEYAEKHLKQTNIPAVIKSVERVLSSDCFVETDTKPFLGEVKDMMENGKMPVCLLNYCIITGQPDTYKGHYAIVTDISDGIVTYHDSGPVGAAPNKTIVKERFVEAWNLCCFDHGLIVVG